MTSTTTQLLILHEREKQKRPATKLRRQLVLMLSICCEVSSEVDRKEKPAKKGRR